MNTHTLTKPLANMMIHVQLSFFPIKHPACRCMGVQLSILALFTSVLNSEER